MRMHPIAVVVPQRQSVRHCKQLDIASSPTLQAVRDCKQFDMASSSTLQAVRHCKHTLQVVRHCSYFNIASSSTLQADTASSSTLQVVRRCRQFDIEWPPMIVWAPIQWIHEFFEHQKLLWRPHLSAWMSEWAKTAEKGPPDQSILGIPLKMNGFCASGDDFWWFWRPKWNPTWQSYLGLTSVLPRKNWGFRRFRGWLATRGGHKQGNTL